MSKTKEIVNWFISEGVNCSNIPLLLEKQGLLAGYSYHFTEHVGKLNLDYIKAEQERKIKRNTYISNKLAEGATKGASEVGADLMTAEDRITEKYNELQYRNSKLMLEQVNKILDAMTMRISYLKKEQENTWMQQNT